MRTKGRSCATLCVPHSVSLLRWAVSAKYSKVHTQHARLIRALYKGANGVLRSELATKVDRDGTMRA